MILALLAIAVVSLGTGLLFSPGGLITSAMARTRTASAVIYNPHTKSYFQFVPNLDGHGRNWEASARAAENLSYKGVRGHLAIVKDVETHDFILRNFHAFIDGSWIGLRLDCSDRQLRWVDGTEMKPDDFAVWDLGSWHRSDITCSTVKIRLMGVFYRPASDLLRWQAAGEAKAGLSMIVEYPTGKP